MTRIFLFISMILVLGASLAAQDKNPQFKSIDQLRKNSQDATLFDQLQVARQLLGRGAYISAADLLEKLYQENEDNPEIFNALLRCYEELKADTKAETLIKGRMEKYPFEFGNHRKLIEHYLQNGNDSLAQQQIELTLEAFPANPDVYGAIVRNLVDQGYNDLAIYFIDRGRTQFEDNNLFALAAARIHESRRDYDPAVREYFKVLTGDSLVASAAERRMSMLIRYPEAPQTIIKTLSEFRDSLPDNQYVYKFLQEAYLKNEQFTEAFSISSTLDSMTDQKGLVLYRYMRLCRDRKLYGQVIKTAEYIEERNFEKIAFGDYKFYHAEALLGHGQYDSAISKYEEIVTEYPRKHEQAEALFEIGKIYRYQLNDLITARKYFDSLLAHLNVGTINPLALNEIGLIYLVRGDLDSSRAVFENLINMYRAVEDKERVEYQIALIEFYRKDFEKANLAFRRLLAQYPRGFYVNDALINSLIISEAQAQFPDALGKYAEAIYCEARMMPDSVKQKYQEVIDQGLTTLVGLSIYKLADYSLKRADTARAESLISEMEAQYTDDYFYPYCLKLKGDILKYRGDAESAKEVYQDLLKQYNQYPFTSEVRTILQAMTEARPAS